MLISTKNSITLEELLRKIQSWPGVTRTETQLFFLHIKMEQCYPINNNLTNTKGRKMDKLRAEYIWMDGHQPTQKLRSKTKVINRPINSLDDLPLWGFDGSSTNQADGNDSDCMLKPVFMTKDPIRGANDILVMCEVMNADGSIHSSNTRAHLRKVAKNILIKNHGLALNKNTPYLRGAIL